MQKAAQNSGIVIHHNIFSKNLSIYLCLVDYTALRVLKRGLNESNNWFQETTKAM